MELSILSNLVISEIHWATTKMLNSQGVGGVRKERPYWAILLKYEGETVYTFQGKKVVSNIGNMVILPKGSSYSWQCTQTGRCAEIEFESEPVCPEIFAFPVKNGDRFLKLFREIEYKRTAQSPLYQLESLRDTYTVLLELVRTKQRAYRPTGYQKKIEPVLAYMAKHYNERLSNDRLAALTGFSAAYFRKMFTETVGVSPIGYLHSLRIKKAKEMLRSDYSSISDIAQALGYASIYDFSRAFKKHTGIAPSKY